MRIGIFGGTFDPVHLGHIWIARAARDELGLDKLFMIPAGDPPHKPDPSRLAGNVRMRMLEIAIKNEDAFAAAKELGKTEGFLVGISSGAALHAAIEYAKKPENKGKTIVALLPDSGDRYYSTALFTE